MWWPCHTTFDNTHALLQNGCDHRLSMWSHLGVSPTAVRGHQVFSSYMLQGAGLGFFLGALGTEGALGSGSGFALIHWFHSMRKRQQFAFEVETRPPSG